ncbi:MAG: hypothetical protein ABJP08_04935 [Roseibium sp.]
MSGTTLLPGSVARSDRHGAGLLSLNQARYPMRAEMEAIVDEIKQAISLLRRHL